MPPDSTPKTDNWGLTEAAANSKGTLRTLFSGKVHQAMTTITDELTQRGFLSQADNKILTQLKGDMLKLFNQEVPPELADVKLDDDCLAEIAAKEVSAVASPYDLHGPGSLLGTLGAGRSRKKKAEPMSLLDRMFPALRKKEKAGAQATTKEAQPEPPAAALTPPTPAGPQERVAITQDAAGKWRWVLFTSSNFEDSDDEIVSKEFHQADVARMNASGDLGTVNWWHVGTPTDDDPEPELPMLALGDCDFSDLHETADGVMRIESGTFYDDRIGAAFSQQQGELSASLAFSHKSTEPKDGVFTKGRTMERSILPAERASNYLAGLAELVTHKETGMEKTKELAERLGPDGDAIVDNLLAKAGAKLKAAKEAGITAKAKKPKAADEAGEDEKTEDPASDDPKEEAAEDKPADEAADKPEDKKAATKKEADAPAVDVTALSQKIDDLTEVVAMLVGVSEKETTETKEARAAEGKRIAALEKQIATATKELKALQGDLPRGVRSYRPSQSDENELEPGEAEDLDRLKRKETEGDPAGSSVVDWIISGRKPTV